MQRLSLGIQEFSKIVSENCIYVDKTKQIYNLLTKGQAYFLSRPRRFGKSLLVNTLKEIFLGNKELFKGTYIYDKLRWEKSPVIKLDFSGMAYKQKGLEKALVQTMNEIAGQYEVKLNDNVSSGLFKELIIKLSEKYSPVAILIDEYDKPISDYIDDLQQAGENRETMKTFYSCLKGLDSHIKFLFITGVSKFGKVSIFSDLNHLTDLTILEKYSTIVGYTFEELKIYFSDYMEAIRQKFNYSSQELFEKMREKYNGYSWDAVNFVYNPFSIQSFFQSGQFGNFWFATGTATFLVKALKNQGKLPDQISPKTVQESFFDKFELENMDLESLLFQTGYLTIKKIDQERGRFTLAFPNGEVENAFLNNLLEVWSDKRISDLSQVLINIEDGIAFGKPEQFIDAFHSLFSGIPYDDFRIEHAIEPIFRSNVYIALKIMGVRQQVEVHTNVGRIDAVIEDKETVFICEFKMGGAEDAKKAMAQIHEKKYYDSFRNSGKKIFLIGLAFDEEKRNIENTLVETIET